MSTGPNLMDPEVEGILREIAADPRSRLLRVDRPGLFSAILDHDPRISSFAAGLTAAERHLLDVHRAEVAWLLREACLMKFYGDVDYAMWVDETLPKQGSRRISTIAQWNRRKEAELALDEDESVGDAYDLVRRCFESRAALSVTQLASMALRLEPRDNARLYIAFDLLFTRQVDASRRILLDLFESPPSLANAAAAHEALALGYAIQGDRGAALKHSRYGTELELDSCEPPMNWVLNALLLEDLDELVRASFRLNEVAGREHPSVQSFVRRIEVQNELGMLTPSPRARSLAQEHGDALAPAARRIVRALV